MDITDFAGIDPIPDVAHPSDGENIHYDHLTATLLFNILLELKEHRILLDAISSKLGPAS